MITHSINAIACCISGFRDYHDSRPPLGALLGVLLLGLEGGELELLTNTTSQLLPEADILALVPSQKANPRLNVVVHLEFHVVLLGNLAAGVGDLVLGLLVPQLEDATIDSCQAMPLARCAIGARLTG